MNARHTRTPPKSPSEWIAYKIGGAKAAMLGHVKAAGRNSAIAAAAEEFRVPAGRIIVQAVSRV
jgi:hypothetical protein